MTHIETELQRINDEIADINKDICTNQAQHKDIMDSVKRIEDKLEPVLDVFITVKYIGKWGMAILIIISIIIGIVSEWSRAVKWFFK